MKKRLSLVFLIAGALALTSACQTTGVNQSGHTGFDGHLVKTQLDKKDVRGGTTTGTKVQVDKTPSQAFENIQKAKTKKEKDRQAILAQTGDYKVSFEFIETLNFEKDKKRAKPYHSWATEYIFPVKLEKNFISLQHILVMTVVDDKGKVSEPMVTKHWRQDWTYEPQSFFEYVGYNTWKKRSISASERKGAWKQAVYQVDDSPRYQGIGHWQHNEGFSTWTSQTTTRPLPRREFSYRNDYDLLKGQNRVTVVPSGWYHEQDNLKVVVNKKSLQPKKYLARETGVNTYTRIKNFDFSKGKKYWQASKNYWKDVRKHWDKVLNNNKTLHLEKKVDGKKLYQTHFDFVDQIQKNPKKIDLKKSKKHASKTIDSFVN